MLEEIDRVAGLVPGQSLRLEGSMTKQEKAQIERALNVLHKRRGLAGKIKLQARGAVIQVVCE